MTVPRLARTPPLGLRIVIVFAPSPGPGDATRSVDVAQSESPLAAATQARCHGWPPTCWQHVLRLGARVLLLATKHEGRLGNKGTRCGISTRENYIASSARGRDSRSRILAGFIGQIKDVAPRL